ncbi:MAG: type IV toxin-antitoxin system AbiEi family antitoxin [Bacteroidales bacterium]|nr:type IV toxin-antitoxin system AbiEi family antitoxin [Bacteroidales bacterium]MCF8392082.1 type IV toxin-antitoxin system AbiEi family antitoxin [Bacteroidales bacterium]
MTLATYIKQLLSIEEYSFSLDELIDKLNRPETTIKSELSRLIKKNEILNLRKGFYLIITPRYSSTQKLPVQLYCEKLFSYLNRKYYVGLFSASKIHGASHQQVQRDYLITERPKFNDISKNTIDIRFFTTSNWNDKNIQVKQSDAGIYKISSPALTMVDLIHHQTRLGGINRMLATIEELCEELTKSDLIELLTWYPNRSTLQRLGFLIEEQGANEEFQEILFANLKSEIFFPVLLSPKSNKKPGAVRNRWKVDVNVNLESDL